MSFGIPLTAVGGSFKSTLFMRRLRINSKDLKYPPTTVSGIKKRFMSDAFIERT